MKTNDTNLYEPDCFLVISATHRCPVCKSIETDIQVNKGITICHCQVCQIYWADVPDDTLEDDCID